MLYTPGVITEDKWPVIGRWWHKLPLSGVWGLTVLGPMCTHVYALKEARVHQGQGNRAFLTVTG